MKKVSERKEVPAFLDSPDVKFDKEQELSHPLGTSRTALGLSFTLLLILSDKDSTVLRWVLLAAHPRRYKVGPHYRLLCLQCTKYSRHNVKEHHRYNEAPLTLGPKLKRMACDTDSQRAEDEGRLIQLLGQHSGAAPLVSSLFFCIISPHIRHSMTVY